jgi:hypothetical protein
MGTLFHQEPRNWRSITESDIKEHIEMIKQLAKETKLTVDQVIKVEELLELERRNNLYVSNGDIHDEQMQGLGEILQEIRVALRKNA